MPTKGRGGGVMRTTPNALRRVPQLLMTVLLPLGAPCVAQDVEHPTPPPTPVVPTTPVARSSLFTPAFYLEVILPTTPVGLRFYSFFVTELKTPVELLEIPVQVASYLTVTGSYQYLRVPKSEVGDMTTVPVEFGQPYAENQLRLEATLKFVIGHLEIGERNMFVRRFRPAWVGPPVNRYRNRLMLTQLVRVHGRVWKPFASYEGSYDSRHFGWIRYRLWSGVTVPMETRVSFQPSFVRDDNRAPGIRDVDYFMFALITRVR
jgi:hypothetical protein